MARIIFADDDDIYLGAFCEGMNALGHSAEGVPNGKQLLQRLREEHFDIAFLDVLMAGGGAVSLMHSVREISQDLPVVVITGWSSLMNSRLFQEGLRQAQAKVSKTASLEELESLVRQLTETS